MDGKGDSVSIQKWMNKLIMRQISDNKFFKLREEVWFVDIYKLYNTQIIKQFAILKFYTPSMPKIKTSLSLVGNYMCKNPPIVVFNVTEYNNEK